MQPNTNPSSLGAITERQRLTLLVVAVAGHAVKHTFASAFFVLLPSIKADLLLSNIQVGTLSTIRNVAGGLANLPAGFAADRFTRQRPLILGLSLAFIGVFAFALGLATTFWAAVIASTLMIVAITFWHPSAIGSLSRHFAERRGLAIGLHGTGGSIGEALGPLVAGLLLSVLTWQVVLRAGVGPALLLGIAIWLLIRPIPMGDAALASLGEYVRSLRRLFANRRLLLVLLFAAGFSGGQSAVLTFLPIYLREDLGASSVTLGLYLSAAQIVGIASQPVMGHLSDRLGRKAVLAPALAALGLTLVGLTLVPSGWPFLLMMLLMGAFLFPLMSILLASGVDLVEPGAQATVVSLVFGSAVVVAGLSPAVAGALADAYGVPSTFLWAAGIVLATALVAGVTRWERVR